MGEARPMLWGEFPRQRGNCHRNLQKLHGAGEMVPYIKCLLFTCEDLSWIPRTQILKSKAHMTHVSTTPAVGRQRKAVPIGSLT